MVSGRFPEFVYCRDGPNRRIKICGEPLMMTFLPISNPVFEKYRKPRADVEINRYHVGRKFYFFVLLLNAVVSYSRDIIVSKKSVVNEKLGVSRIYSQIYSQKSHGR